MTKLANGMALEISPSLLDSTLILTEMWRPQWKSNVGKVFNYHGLIGITVPPNNDTVLINYLPNQGPLNSKFLKAVILIDLLLLILVLVLNYKNTKYGSLRIELESKNN